MLITINRAYFIQQGQNMPFSGMIRLKLIFFKNMQNKITKNIFYFSFILEFLKKRRKKDYYTTQKHFNSEKKEKEKRKDKKKIRKDKKKIKEIIFQKLLMFILSKYHKFD